MQTVETEPAFCPKVLNHPVLNGSVVFRKTDRERFRTCRHWWVKRVAKAQAMWEEDAEAGRSFGSCGSKTGSVPGRSNPSCSKKKTSKLSQVAATVCFMDGKIWQDMALEWLPCFDLKFAAVLRGPCGLRLAWWHGSSVSPLKWWTRKGPTTLLISNLMCWKNDRVSWYSSIFEARPTLLPTLYFFLVQLRPKPWQWQLRSSCTDSALLLAVSKRRCEGQGLGRQTNTASESSDYFTSTHTHTDIRICWEMMNMFVLCILEGKGQKQWWDEYPITFYFFVLMVQWLQQTLASRISAMFDKIQSDKLISNIYVWNLTFCDLTGPDGICWRHWACWAVFSEIW